MHIQNLKKNREFKNVCEFKLFSWIWENVHEFENFQELKKTMNLKHVCECKLCLRILKNDHKFERKMMIQNYSRVHFFMKLENTREIKKCNQIYKSLWIQKIFPEFYKCFFILKKDLQIKKENGNKGKRQINKQKREKEKNKDN